MYKKRCFTHKLAQFSTRKEKNGPISRLVSPLLLKGFLFRNFLHNKCCRTRSWREPIPEIGCQVPLLQQNLVVVPELALGIKHLMLTYETPCQWLRSSHLWCSSDYLRFWGASQILRWEIQKVKQAVRDICRELFSLSQEYMFSNYPKAGKTREKQVLKKFTGKIKHSI